MWIGNGVVVPGRESIVAAVAGPGVSGAAFRHEATGLLVRQNVDPGLRRYPQFATTRPAPAGSHTRVHRPRNRRKNSQTVVARAGLGPVRQFRSRPWPPADISDVVIRCPAEFPAEDGLSARSPFGFAIAGHMVDVSCGNNIGGGIEVVDGGDRGLDCVASKGRT